MKPWYGQWDEGVICPLKTFYFLHNPKKGLMGGGGKKKNLNDKYNITQCFPTYVIQILKKTTMLKLFNVLLLYFL